VEIPQQHVSIVDAGPAVAPLPSALSNPETIQHAESPASFRANEPAISASNDAATIRPRSKSNSIIVLSSSDDDFPSHLSDTPSQLLEEVRKYKPDELLEEARTLALRLPESIPKASPGDLLHVWDANSVDAIVLSLPDGGTDPSEDVEYIDRTLNHVFQGTSVSRLVREMRRGSCGPLGIVEGLSFFANNRGLNLVQFEIKLLKLVKALRKCTQYVCIRYLPHDYILTCHFTGLTMKSFCCQRVLVVRCQSVGAVRRQSVGAVHRQSVSAVHCQSIGAVHC
jgi:hypothetical protein